MKARETQELTAPGMCLRSAAGNQSWHVALAMAGALVVLQLQGCGKKPAQSECTNGAKVGTNCMEAGCCEDSSLSCYKKDDTWAACSASCEPGEHEEDPPQYRTPWSCEVLAPAAPTTTVPVPEGWIAGTWTTGYWDCCKPSCSWDGKGKVDKPVKSCDARTGHVLKDNNVESVCNGGHAATCVDMAPFVVNSGLSMGFAAAAVSGDHGLTGDENCGQCFELKFTAQQHSGPWGGASEGLVGKRMIVQVTNIGKDVTGNHSFDILIPGAGQGIFTNGCTKQFEGYKSEDFDCGKNYGGCKDKDGCAKLPEDMQAGCHWRYDWYEWLKQDGKTNNPFVQFQRVRCPHQLVALSGTTPTDDGEFEIVM